MKTLNRLFALTCARSIALMRAAASLLFVVISACGSLSDSATDAATGDAADGCTAAALAALELALEQQLANALDAAAVDTTITTSPDLTLLLEADDGLGDGDALGGRAAARTGSCGGG